MRKLWVKFSACSGVVDSPSGREIEKINIEDMMKILARDFSEHQILIASIYRYNFNDIHYIELVDRLFHHDPVPAGNTEDGSDEIKKK